VKLADVRQKFRGQALVVPERVEAPEDPDRLNCPSCKGKGKVRGRTATGALADWFVDCPDCDGSGLALAEKPKLKKGKDGNDAG